MRTMVFLLFVVLSSDLFSQNNLREKYVMQHRERDILYFILPFDVPCIEKYDKSSMDVTYITSDSSLMLKMSIKMPYILRIDSISICSDINYPAKDLNIIFLEKENKLWLHRISFRLDYDVWKKLYESERPYDILVYTANHIFQYAFPYKKWLSERMWMSEIFRMIEYNKKSEE